MYRMHDDFKLPRGTVTSEALKAIEESRVLRLDGLTSPIIIESAELYVKDEKNFFVRIRSKDGLEGVAPVNDRAAFCYPIFNQLIVPYFLGKDARDLEALLDGVYVYKSNYKLAGLPLWCSVAYMELAVLDLLGKAAGKSVGRLFGDRIRDKVDIYVSSGNRGTTPQEELDILASWVQEVGAKAIKFKIGGRMSKNADSIEGRSEGLIRLTRDYFGDQMFIHADGNGSYDAQEAVRYGRILEEINAYFYEEPCPFDDLWETKAAADSLTVPIALGEQETSMRRFRWMIENDAAQIIQPDILYNGGLIRTTKVARMAQLAGKTLTPHVSTGFCFVYIQHLASYTPNLGRFQEHKKGFAWSNELMNGCMTLRDGSITIPDLPGIGADPNSPLLKGAVRVL